MKIINSFLLNNIISLPISNFIGAVETNIKAKIMKDKINDMYLSIFNRDLADENNWNQIRNMIIFDLKEVLNKINTSRLFSDLNYNFSNFEFAGLEKDEYETVKNINGFFRIKDLKNQITLTYHKHLASRDELIKKMISMAEQNFIYEEENFTDISISLHEKWKLTLYNWIGDKITLNNEFIPIILKRFEFDRLEKTGQNSYIAWFHYFDTYETIPVKIIVRQKDSIKEKEKRIIEEKKGNSWIKSFFFWLIPTAGLAFLTFCLYLINSSKISLNVSNTIIDDVNVDNYQIPLITLNDEIILNSYSNNIVAVTNPNNSLLQDFLRRIIRTFIRWRKQNRSFSTIKKNQSDDIVDQDFKIDDELKNWDSKYEETLKNISLSDISHNLQFMKWGVFDKMRYGKIKIKNFPHELTFKIFRNDFQTPDSKLINLFYEEIKDILKDLHISKVFLKEDSTFNIVSTIVLQLLNNKSLRINGIKYFFATDSFWIEEVKSKESVVEVKLNHFLFNQPLLIEIPYL